MIPCSSNHTCALRCRMLEPALHAMTFDSCTGTYTIASSSSKSTVQSLFNSRPPTCVASRTKACCTPSCRPSTSSPAPRITGTRAAACLRLSRMCSSVTCQVHGLLAASAAGFSKPRSLVQAAIRRRVSSHWTIGRRLHDIAGYTLPLLVQCVDVVGSRCVMVRHQSTAICTCLGVAHDGSRRLHRQVLT